MILKRRLRTVIEQSNDRRLATKKIAPVIITRYGRESAIFSQTIFSPVRTTFLVNRTKPSVGTYLQCCLFYLQNPFSDSYRILLSRTNACVFTGGILSEINFKKH